MAEPEAGRKDRTTHFIITTVCPHNHRISVDANEEVHVQIHSLLYHQMSSVKHMALILGDRFDTNRMVTRPEHHRMTDPDKYETANSISTPQAVHIDVPYMFLRGYLLRWLQLNPYLNYLHIQVHGGLMFPLGNGEDDTDPPAIFARNKVEVMRIIRRNVVRECTCTSLFPEFGWFC